jgi:hypothetical protein
MIFSPGFQQKHSTIALLIYGVQLLAGEHFLSVSKLVSPE